jgi:hypothetical protein
MYERHRTMVASEAEQLVLKETIVMRTEKEDASFPEKEMTGILSVSGVNFELQCDP